MKITMKFFLSFCAFLLLGANLVRGDQDMGLWVMYGVELNAKTGEILRVEQIDKTIYKDPIKCGQAAVELGPHPAKGNIVLIIVCHKLGDGSEGVKI